VGTTTTVSLQAVKAGQPSAPTDPHDRYYKAGGLLYRYHPIYGAQLRARR
jgi:hypothetical protein